MSLEQLLNHNGLCLQAVESALSVIFVSIQVIPQINAVVVVNHQDGLEEVTNNSLLTIFH
jgi:hypothetical protein